MKDLRQSLTAHDRIMVLAPHPDDETLAAAGLLQWTAQIGAETRVVFMTDGENNPWAQRVTERRWHLSPRHQLAWGARRRQEALRALACLGLAPDRVRFLGMPDQHLTETLSADPEGTTRVLTDELECWRPTLLLVPSLDDRHPDHGATAVLTQLALARGSRTVRVLDYLIHPTLRQRDRWTSFVALSSREREIKRAAVLCHSSQLGWRRGQMLRFADAPERFGEPSHADRPAAQPLQLLRSVPGEMSFAVRRSLRVMLGGVALLLVTPSEDGASTLRVELADPQRRVVVSGASGGGHDSKVTAFRSGRNLQLTISSPCLGKADHCMVKLDASRERNLGFFDPWPWLDLEFDSTRSRESS